MDKKDVQSIFTDNLNRLLKEKDISQIKLAKAIGVSATTVNNYSKGYNMPRMDRLDKIAQYLGVPRSELITEPLDLSKVKGIMPLKRIVRIPILGEIACGEPIFAEENYIGFFMADPEKIQADFAVYAKGDSMIDANINDGDLVFLRKTADVENGKIAAVIIGDEATLKRVRKLEKSILLEPCNPKHTPILLDETTVEDVHIVGEMVGVYSERDS